MTQKKKESLLIQDFSKEVYKEKEKKKKRDLCRSTLFLERKKQMVLGFFCFSFYRKFKDRRKAVFDSTKPGANEETRKPL